MGNFQNIYFLRKLIFGAANFKVITINVKRANFPNSLVPLFQQPTWSCFEPRRHTVTVSIIMQNNSRKLSTKRVRSFRPHALEISAMWKSLWNSEFWIPWEVLEDTGSEYLTVMRTGILSGSLPILSTKLLQS